MSINCRALAHECQRNHNQIDTRLKGGVEERMNEFNVAVHETSRGPKAVLTAVNDAQARVRQQPLQNQRGAGKDPAAHDSDASNGSHFRQQRAKGAFVFSEHEPLQRCRAQNQSLHSVEVEISQPAQYCRPPACS